MTTIRQQDAAGIGARLRSFVLIFVGTRGRFERCVVVG